MRRPTFAPHRLQQLVGNGDGHALPDTAAPARPADLRVAGVEAFLQFGDLLRDGQAQGSEALRGHRSRGLRLTRADLLRQHGAGDDGEADAAKRLSSGDVYRPVVGDRGLS